jgi:hypothetical protein
MTLAVPAVSVTVRADIRRVAPVVVVGGMSDRAGFESM